MSVEEYRSLKILTNRLDSAASIVLDITAAFSKYPGITRNNKNPFSRGTGRFSRYRVTSKQVKRRKNKWKATYCTEK